MTSFIQRSKRTVALALLHRVLWFPESFHLVSQNRHNIPGRQASLLFIVKWARKSVLLNGFSRLQLVSRAIILIWGFLYSLNYTREVFPVQNQFCITVGCLSGEGQVIMVMDIRIKWDRWNDNRWLCFPSLLASGPSSHCARKIKIKAQTPLDLCLKTPPAPWLSG